VSIRNGRALGERPVKREGRYAMSMRSIDAGEFATADANYTPDPTENGDAELGNDDSYSLIDRFSNFDGTFRSNRDLRIDGEVKGTIDCQGTLFVAQGANVTAKVEAENITVAGDLNGEISCRGRLQMMPSGRVRGKVATETLVINEGAYYEGQLQMAAPEERGKNSPRALPTPSQASGSASAGAGETRTERTPIRAASADAAAPSSTFIRRFGGPETPWSGTSDESNDPSPSDTES
jgi:cytoskeletal protein CcmA (bactofilin family)